MKAVHSKVLIKRSRWDRWALVSLAAWAGVTIYVGYSGVWITPLLVTPVLIIVPWILFRLTTPREGMYCRTIRGTPGAVIMLGSSGLALGLMIALIVFDVIILRHPIKAPLEAYHAILFSPPVFILMAGAIWADRTQNAAGASKLEDETRPDH